jgi:Zn-dependent protease/CBS domain-containing protein
MRGRGGIKVGQFFGINIYIDWSWLLIFLLITWNLASMFAEIHTDWGTTLTWGLGLVASILFFASVLAHEIAHSLVARSQGLPVRRITLFLFGGVSNIEREPPSPRAEFLISIVGPVTSIVLGLIFILISGVSTAAVIPASGQGLQALSGLSPLTTMLLWLGPINLILGIFNMVPGFPLDGGRILRSILWSATDSLRKATRWASYVGQAVAWLMIGAGIAMAFGVQIPFFGTGLVSGLWLAFIGWFLHSASVQGYQQVVIRDILEGIPVERMMKRGVPKISGDISVDRLVQEIMEGDDYAFVVMDGEQMAGIVTLQDMRKVDKDLWADTRVREIMTPREDLAIADPHEDAAEALSTITQRDIRQIPVVENGDLLGLVRRRDIIRWLQIHSDAQLTG